MTKNISVHLFAYTGMSLLDFSGPLDVFHTANFLSRGPSARYEVTVVSVDGNVEISPGMSLQTLRVEDAKSVPHTLIVPGGPTTAYDLKDNAFLTAFRHHALKARRLASVCSGAFVLAAAGQLDGRRATTHWSHYDDLERRFPRVRVERGPIFVNDGPIWTSAGVTAGIDLALALVQQDIGQSIALQVARQLVMFLRRPGDQAQFSGPLNLQSKSDRFSELHIWICDNLAQDLSVPVLARQVNMSERTFMRQYRAKLGLTPSKVVETLRLEAGRNLIVDSHRSIKEIAQRCGFLNEETFIRRFSKMFGTSPGQYRIHFGMPPATRA